MKILNALEKAHKDLAGRAAHAVSGEEGFSILLRLLSPITPHICHALWQDCGFGADILGAALAGSRRGGAEAGRDRADAAGQRQAARQHQGRRRRAQGRHRGAALASEAAQKFMDCAGKPAKKVVVVPGRLVNIVV
jgi:leucyl-tRNA synthetase